MSGELTQYGANRAVTAGVGGAVSAIAAVYVALATAQPGTPDTATLADFAANELTTAGYARQAVTFGSPSGDPSEVANTAAITFGPYTDDPPEVAYCFLCDAASGDSGNVLAYWTLGTARDNAIGDSPQFAVGALTMSVD